MPRKVLAETNLETLYELTDDDGALVGYEVDYPDGRTVTYEEHVATKATRVVAPLAPQPTHEPTPSGGTFSFTWPEPPDLEAVSTKIRHRAFWFALAGAVLGSGVAVAAGHILH